MTIETLKHGLLYANIPNTATLSKMHKKNSVIITLLLLLGTTQISYSQYSDTTKQKNTYRQYIIPATLITSGVIFNNSKIEKTLKQRITQINNSQYKIDNLLPIIIGSEVYISEISNIKSKNNFITKTKYLVISNIISSTIAFALKYTVNKTRPNSEPRSMPSGHTTIAFTCATAVFKEYGQSSPIIAYSGYALATTTGTVRLINNKHWLSDVLVGAGIGILTTNLVYSIEPLKNVKFLSKFQNLTLTPLITPDSNQISLTYKF